MGKSNYQSLMDEINGMAKWQTVALTAACAEKAAPIIRRLALPATWAFASECLDFAWSAASTGWFDEGKVKQLRVAFDATPELNCEYPDSLAFVVTQALSFCDYVLLAVSLASSPREAAKNVGFSQMLETAELFDLALEQDPDPRVGKPRMVEAEGSSQQLLVAILRGQAQPSRSAIQPVRDEAKKIGDAFEIALPAYCYHFLRGLIEADELRAQP